MSKHTCRMCNSYKHGTEVHIRRLTKARLKSKKWKASLSSDSKRSKLKKWWGKHYKEMCEVRQRQVTLKERKRLAKLVQDNWNNPKWRKRMERVRKEQCTPEVNEANSKRLVKLWRDPEYRNTQIKAIHTKKWKKAVAKSNTLHKTGVPAWNAGLTKYDTPSLMSASKKLRGRLPEYNKYKCWYPNEKDHQIEMRCSWEVAVALWMDDCDIEWEHQARWFYIGTGDWLGETYTPDFYLRNQRTHVEIKGYYSPENERKMNRFYALYPDVKLLYFEGEQLEKILDKYQVLKKKKEYLALHREKKAA